MSPLFSYGRSERRYGRSPTEPSPFERRFPLLIIVSKGETFGQRPCEMSWTREDLERIGLHLEPNTTF